MSCENLFLNQLHERGFRLTPQREMVLVALHNINHPAATEEIFDLVAQKSASVELSTVYRTLELLHSMGLVNLIDTGDKLRLYELAGSQAPHVHLVCRKCGAITGVEIKRFQPLVSFIWEEAQFRAELGSLTLSGLCAGCEGTSE